MDDLTQLSQAPEVQSQMPSPVNNSSGSKIIPIILGVAVVLIIAIGSYVLGSKNNQTIVQNQQSSIVPTVILSPPHDINREKIGEDVHKQKCEFPEMIGNLTTGGVDNTSAMVTRDISGAVSSLTISYSNLRSIDPKLLANELSGVVITIASVDIVTFKTISDAQTYYSIGSKKPEVSQFSSCTVKETNGLCLFDSSIFTLPEGSSEGKAYTMIWLNGNTFKIVRIATAKTETESVADADKRTKELVELFVSAFDDCGV